MLQITPKPNSSSAPTVTVVMANPPTERTRCDPPTNGPYHAGPFKYPNTAAVHAIAIKIAHLMAGESCGRIATASGLARLYQSAK